MRGDDGGKIVRNPARDLHVDAHDTLNPREESMIRTIAGAALALLLAAAGPADAQDWPTRPVTMIVPYAAGGPVDTMARILASRLSEILGQQIVIENVGGAGGMTGASRAAKAAPDGYTVRLSGSAVLAINQTLYKRPLYNAVTDFEHAALFSDSARILIARKDLPANTLPEFVAYAKANQGNMQYGSAGAGSGMHVCAVLLDVAMGTRITHVPYRGAAPAMQDLIGGRIDFVAEQISTALPQIQAGSVKAIATLGLDRAPGLENLPTAQELGLSGLDCGSWGSLSFPKGTPHEIVQRLAKAANDAVETPAVRERYKSIGVTIPAPERRTPEYLAKFVPSEIERWAGPIKASGASAD
jgi:tripartite-type tricarboxylate transporter receptor subunit TctC